MHELPTLLLNRFSTTMHYSVMSQTNLTFINIFFYLYCNKFEKVRELQCYAVKNLNHSSQAGECLRNRNT